MPTNVPAFRCTVTCLVPMLTGRLMSHAAAPALRDLSAFPVGSDTLTRGAIATRAFDSA